MDQDDEKSSVSNMIDENLRKVYESVLNEEVPDRFTDLLARLKAGETSSAGRSDDSNEGDTA
ncbi:MAG: NepR family anti-sigma factor [Pseudomonadota bacterium]